MAEGCNSTKIVMLIEQLKLATELKRRYVILTVDKYAILTGMKEPITFRSCPYHTCLFTVDDMDDAR